KSIVVEDTYNSFAILSNLFSLNIKSNGIISDYSLVNNTSVLKKNVQIDSFVEIKENCKINDNVIIQSNCKIGPNVVIGPNSIIFSNSNLQDCIVGSDCVIKSGAIIGGTGFGFDPKSKVSINHIGNVVIGDNCKIGSNTTIDRAVFDSTIISKNSFIDNLVQIAHNVFIGEAAIIAAQTGIAGSTIIGENVVIGGQAGISGHLIIGKNVQIAAKSGVTKNIKDNSIIAGFPAVDIKKWKISNIKLNKL
ncbi:UDP-3-O-(3-hydroxymyristoyl)glucosamine N-acyltransferase, partial [Alphaproteobacteria bacterium]|nr:UDP-3-O-(3-hydroxymyristoyl)glucosamine N-acyltransferase [Alphaproteobacteria bacterium]